MRTKIGFGMMFLAIVTAASPTARAGGLIGNGSFETPIVDHATDYAGGDPALSPWNIVAGTSVAIVPQPPIATGTGWDAYEGRQSLDLNGSSDVPPGSDGHGEIQQSFGVSGNSQYYLIFRYANNPENGFDFLAKADVKVFDTYAPSTILGSWSIEHTHSVPLGMDYTFFSSTFTTGQNTTNATLDFTSTVAGNFGIVLDSVSVLVPELDPGSAAAALTLLGGGVLRLNGRRRRK